MLRLTQFGHNKNFSKTKVLQMDRQTDRADFIGPSSRPGAPINQCVCTNQTVTWLVISCSKLTSETLEKGGRYIINKQQTTTGRS